jgi:hypothetical protein
MKRSLAILLVALACSASGCASFKRAYVWTWDQFDPPVEKEPTLPTNPATPPDIPGSSSEKWYFGPKLHQSPPTYRVRWPSMFAKQTGNGSYTVAWWDGVSVKAPWRAFDTDNGARRPSYNLGVDPRPVPPVTLVLHSPDGTALAWFRVESLDRQQGRLP